MLVVVLLWLSGVGYKYHDGNDNGSLTEHLKKRGSRTFCENHSFSVKGRK